MSSSYLADIHHLTSGFISADWGSAPTNKVTEYIPSSHLYLSGMHFLTCFCRFCMKLQFTIHRALHLLERKSSQPKIHSYVRPRKCFFKPGKSIRFKIQIMIVYNRDFCDLKLSKVKFLGKRVGNRASIILFAVIKWGFLPSLVLAR